MQRKSKLRNKRDSSKTFTPRLEILEQRQMLAADWNNAVRPLDVDSSQEVAPLDVLLVINELNDPAYTDLNTGILLHDRPDDAPFLDIDNDGYVSPVDALQVMNWLNGFTLPPEIEAALTNDTAPSGTTNADLLTSDATISGTVTDDTGVGSRLVARVNGGDPLVVPLSPDGTFELTPSLALDGSADGQHTVVLTAIDPSGQSADATISFSLDTLPPTAASFELTADSRLEAANPALTNLSSVNVVGQAEPGQSITLQTTGSTATAAGDGSFSFTGLDVTDGLNPYSTIVEDAAGNTNTFGLTISKPMAPLGDEPIQFTEGANWVVEQSLRIDLGQDEGSRRYTFDVESQFDETDTDVLVGDLFQVYLVDPMNPGETLLDRGREGEALFSLGETGADFLPGLVTFDGVSVSIDLTSLADHSEGLLVFQLINGDLDNGSTVTVSNVANTLDAIGVESPVFTAQSVVSSFGEEVDLSGYFVVSDGVVYPDVENVRVDGEFGTYKADITLRNVGAPISRQMAIRFNGLPDGVTISNATGIDSATGLPYFNVSPTIPFGGLDRGTMTSVMELNISNPDAIRFELDFDILSTGMNQAPTLSAIDDISIMPGDTATIDLIGNDTDGDSVYFAIPNGQELPSSTLRGNQLTFSSSMDEIGSYTVTVLASDGTSTVERQFSLDVVQDPVSTTRLSGRIMDSNGVTPLAGVPVEINGSTSITGEDGYFTIETSQLSQDDALKVRGNDATFAGRTYPFVAEKLHLILPNGPFGGANNTITRPIYLPVLDVAGGTTIDPASDTMVSQEISPGETAEVFVSSGSLTMDDGNGGDIPFDGTLSITEVPRDFTPAALPDNLIPDIVVTIQPGEMIFNDPAELTLPNRAGYAPGTMMDLWSINPVTGLFDNVGTGQVSLDGSIIETISGGVLNSSWHAFTPEPEEETDSKDDNENQDEICDECEYSQNTNSEIELHSGAVRESHDLATYQSLGQTRGITLHYNSQRADAKPIVNFSAKNINSGEGRYRVAAMSFHRGNYSQQVPGSTSGSGPPSGSHFWQIPAGTNDLTSALQGDLSSQPSGVYGYTISRGSMQLGGDGNFSGTLSESVGEIVHVNSNDSDFGAGWELGGQQQIVENPDSSILLIDGSGSNLRFMAPSVVGESYVSPPGDFTELTKGSDGSFTRTTKNMTVYQFDVNGYMTSMTDRNGNVTQHVYENGQLTRIVDPVGLTTEFFYSANGKVESIVDPGGRTTSLTYDSLGNLTIIEDPDGAARRFDYDSGHRLVGEIDQNGNSEETIYGFHGRSTGSIRRDGTPLEFQTLQTARLSLPSVTTGDLNAVQFASESSQNARVSSSDSGGSVEVAIVDQQGQWVSADDGIGSLGTVNRNTQNLVDVAKDGRSFNTEVEYDSQGNTVGLSDSISNTAIQFPNETAPIGSLSFFSVNVVAADFNGDGLADIAYSNVNDDLSGFIGVRLGTTSGEFTPPASYAEGDFRLFSEILVADLNNDGFVDLIASGGGGAYTLLGNGDGTFQDALSSSVQTGDTTRDIDNDGFTDLIGLSRNDREVFVYRGRGDGQFFPRESISTGREPNGLAIDDFTNDGILDAFVLTSLNLSLELRLYAGLGNGQFEFHSSLPIEGQTASDLLSRDFNGDGLPDLAVKRKVRLLDNSAAWIFLVGQPSGSFQRVALGGNTTSGNIIPADVNDDGILDLYATGDDYTSILVGNGDGSFTSDTNSYIPHGGSVDTLLADFDGDTVPDLATVEFVLGTAELFVRPDSSLPTLSVDGLRSDIVSGDSNNDGILDLIGTTGNSIWLAQGIEGGTFAEPLLYDTASNPYSVYVDDLNNDGIEDVVTTHFRTISILLGRPSGGFSPFQSYASTQAGHDEAAILDLNNDGILDISLANDQSRSVSVLLGNGDGTFQTESIFAVGILPRSVTYGDFNSDGNPDLIVANSASDTVSTLLGRGDGSFLPSIETDTIAGPSSIVATDFNDDGILDFAVENSRVISLYFGLGDGSFTAGASYNAEVGGNVGRALFLTDLDNDNDEDLLALDGQSNAISKFFVLEDGTLSEANRIIPGASPGAIVTGDFNRDGVTDIASANVESDDVSLLFGSRTDATNRKSFEYDPIFNQLTLASDELGRTVLYAIAPENGNRLSMTEVIGELDSADNGESDDIVTRYSYTTRGQLDLMTDPLGRVTDYDYDQYGRMERVTFAVGTTDEAFQLFEYGALSGNQTAVVDENGNRTEFEYDEMNRLTKITDTDPDGDGPLESPVTMFDYDNRGNMIETTDAEGSTTTFVYDELDRIEITRDDDDNETINEYSPDGNLISVTDPNGNETEFTYDARDRRTSSIDPDGGVTSFRYDLDGNLLSLIDPIGNTTRFAYDARDRLIREVDPLGEETIYVYDAVDNLIEMTDRNGRITRFTYDTLDRLIQETWVNADGSEANLVIYSYDKVGNLLNLSDNVSSLVYAYDFRDRVLTVDNTGTLVGSGLPSVVLAYAYDGVGNVESVTETIDGVAEATTAYEYDGLNRAEQISQFGGGASDKLVDFVYNGLGQFDEISRYSDLTRANLVTRSDYSYDDLNRLISLEHGSASNARDIAFYDFEYDPASRIDSISDVDGRTEYSYDDRDQLAGANRDTDDIRGNENYQYDANGNRVDSHLHGDGYVTGDANRLVSDGTYNYSYDDEGNLISRTEIASGNYRILAYDHRNRLTDARDFAANDSQTQQVEFGYDVHDRRIAKTVSNSTDVRTEHFVYFGLQTLLEFSDSDGDNSVAIPELTSRYVFEPGIDNVISMEVDGRTQWSLTDHLGTVHDIVDDDGTLASHIVFDSLGNVVQPMSGQPTTRYLFTGREFDRELDIYYYRARYLSTVTGQFLSEDPIGYLGGDANLRRYVRNNSLRFTDALGLESEEVEPSRTWLEFFQTLGGLLATKDLPPGADVVAEIGGRACNELERFGNQTGLNDGKIQGKEIVDKLSGNKTLNENDPENPRIFPENACYDLLGSGKCKK